MGDALSCLDDREEEKQRYNEKPPQKPQPAANAGAAQPAAPAAGSSATQRDGSVTRSNYRARSNSRARDGGGDGGGDADAGQGSFAGGTPAADSAAGRREEVSKEKMDRARTLLRAAIKAENVEMIDEAIRKAAKTLPTEELEQAQASKRRISRLQKDKAATARVPASAPDLRNSGKTPAAAPAPTSKVPKTSASLTAPPAPAAELSPGDEAAQAAAIEKLELVVGERRLPELADAIAEAEEVGVGKKEPALRKAKEMKEADSKRKEMARMRRAKERGDAN